MHGGALVAIEADPLFNAGSTFTGYTFYGTMHVPADGRDNREPLAAAWISVTPPAPAAPIPSPPPS